jgi:hypothetical protein
MTAFLEPREGVLIARKGEEIVCPGCLSTLATYARDFLAGDGVFADAIVFSAAASANRFPDGSVEMRCASCPLPAGAAFKRNRAATALLCFIRSGSWVGWRGLGE